MNPRVRRLAGALTLTAALLLALSAAPAPVQSTTQLDAWAGTYTFGEDGGRTAGGSVIYVVHQLVVGREGGRLTARLESNGYQTYAALVCEARVEAGRLKVFFARHADENVLQRGDYRPGDHLLTLARSGTGRRARLLTYWGRFRPQFARPLQGRVRFRKEDSSQ